LRVQGRAEIARELRERFGDVLLRVHGFFVKEGEHGPYVTLAGAAGLVVPVRDPAGRIIALKVRADKGGKGPRYSAISSTKHGGPCPGAPMHAPIGTPSTADVVRLTEGELKADVAFALSGLPTLSCPGASTWRAVLPAIEALGAKTVRLAFDADTATNPLVARALADCAAELAGRGLAVEVERWNADDGKGIDDALAAEKAVEVLTGDDAQRAIQAALDDAGGGLDAEGETDGSDVFARVRSILDEQGAAALFGNVELLRDLAALAEANPAAFAGVRAAIRERVSLRDLDRALAPMRSAARRERREGAGASAPPPYTVAAGRIVRTVETEDGPAAVPLCNFTAGIVEEIIRDDASGETTRALAVEGRLADGRPLPRVEVSADDFGEMRWVIPLWGASPTVTAGAGMRDHLRAALQLLSGDVPRRVVRAHLGWAKDESGRWVYLHAGGAIGADGLDESAAVSLPPALTNYRLPAPDSLADAVRASLRLLTLGPARLTFPLLVAPFRAVLGEVDFSVHLIGPTGCYKSEAAALAQQHFGPGLDARHLPSSWASTANATEEILFTAKDSLVVVDDYCPAGAVTDVARLNREADRIFRGAGNRAGRQRMNADGTLRPPRPPRGLTLSTGEDVPRGQSLRARLLILEVEQGDFGPRGDNPTLSSCQLDAGQGLYSLSLSGFLRWLAPRLDGIRKAMADDLARLRLDATALPGAHARTPGIVASLALGLRHFLDFALNAGAITSDERNRLWAEGWAALNESGAEQAAHTVEEEPAGRFVGLLCAAIASGAAHLAGPDGKVPTDPRRWGWREWGDSWQSVGARIGWVNDDGEVFLEPAAALRAAQQFGREQGEPLTVSAYTLRRRLRDRGYLASTDADRCKLTVRRMLQGERRDVLHLLWTEDGPETRPDGPVAESEPAHDRETPDAPRHRTASQKPGMGRMGRMGRLGQSSPQPTALQNAERNGHHDEWGE
jgi:Domain of unknown function (DUF3854)/Domain of unknown function (DUF927)